MPTLALPEKSLPAKDLDIRTRSVRAWLDALPPSRPVDAANALFERVHRANRTAIHPDERLEFLRTIRPFAEMVVDELSHLCERATLPLTDRAREALNASRTLATELSLACRVAAVENTGRLLAFGARRRIPALLVQAADWMAAVLVASYRTYTPLPPGTWRQLHEIYLFAEEGGFAANEIEEELGRSVQAAYCQSLLLSLADPYRLRPAETDAIVAAAGSAMDAATITRAAPRTPTAAHFVVDSDADRGPRVAGGAPTRGASMRVLDANAVIDRLRARRAALRDVPASSSKARAATDEAALIDKLLALWGDPPRRGFRRGASQSSVAICVGLAAVRHFVAKEALDEAAQADAIRRGITMPLLAIADDEAPEAHPVLEWDIVDEGAGGLKVRRMHPRQVVSVGEIVGIRMLGRPRWIVGVVRWMSTSEDGALDFGLQFLAPGAIPVWLQPTITAMPQARPGLLLQGAGDADDVLLSPPDTFSEMREFEVNRVGDGTSCVRAMSLIERTGRFELFAFSEETA
jgi:hypothetical protein